MNVNIIDKKGEKVLTFKFGKGQGDSCSFPMGMPQAKLNEAHRKLSLNTMAKNLAKQFSIKNGEIVFESINFTYYKGK